MMYLSHINHNNMINNHYNKNYNKPNYNNYNNPKYNNNNQYLKKKFLKINKRK